MSHHVPLDAWFAAFDAYLRGVTDEQGVRGLADASEQPRLRVYRNGSVKACADVVLGNYPTVVALVGDEMAMALAREYVAVHPPVVTTLLLYGEHFPAWLDAHQSATGLDYLADFARLDCAWMFSYFAPDEGTLDAQWVQSRTENDDVATRKVTLAAHVQRVDTRYAVLEAWAVLKEQGALGDRVELDAGLTRNVLWRTDEKIRFVAVDEAHAAFLDTLGVETTLGEAVSNATGIDENYDVATNFARLLTEGYLVSR